MAGKGRNKTETSAPQLRKARTGITGLDEITDGGFPAGRPTLVCGGPGCGKTILAMEFLVRGALELGEPGLFVSFEETTPSLIENFRSMGFDIAEMIKQKQLKIAHVDLTRGEIVETGDFTLDALFIRMDMAIKEIGAKRIVLDTMEMVFATLSESSALRREISRLFQWLRERNVTCIITGERGDKTLTRHGFEEYVSDCVVVLDHRISEQISKRRLRVLKYRGSEHGKDEYPFVVGKTGFSVYPITAAELDYPAGHKRVSTGINDLDVIMGGKGFFKGTSVLVSGKAGTGKSSVAAAFAAAACARNERSLYLAFEESASQLARNMQSVGIDLGTHLKTGLLTVSAFRPTYRGLEEHLIAIHEMIAQVAPACIVIDPVTNFLSVGNVGEVKAMLSRVLDTIKERGITLLMTALTPGSGKPDETDTDISSVVDAWIALDQILVNHCHQRELFIVKARGMAHSAQTFELLMSADGLSLREISDTGQKTV